jgi:hypothetical protein
MEMNKNPMGLAALAHNPVGWVAFMADKSALFKSWRLALSILFLPPRMLFKG